MASFAFASTRSSASGSHAAGNPFAMAQTQLPSPVTPWQPWQSHTSAKTTPAPWGTASSGGAWSSTATPSRFATPSQPKAPSTVFGARSATGRATATAAQPPTRATNPFTLAPSAKGDGGFALSMMSAPQPASTFRWPANAPSNARSDSAASSSFSWPAPATGPVQPTTSSFSWPAPQAPSMPKATSSFNWPAPQGASVPLTTSSFNWPAPASQPAPPTTSSVNWPAPQSQPAQPVTSSFNWPVAATMTRTQPSFDFKPAGGKPSNFMFHDDGPSLAGGWKPKSQPAAASTSASPWASFRFPSASSTQSSSGSTFTWPPASATSSSGPTATSSAVPTTPASTSFSFPSPSGPVESAMFAIVPAPPAPSAPVPQVLVARPDVDPYRSGLVEQQVHAALNVGRTVESSPAPVAANRALSLRSPPRSPSPSTLLRQSPTMASRVGLSNRPMQSLALTPRRQTPSPLRVGLKGGNATVIRDEFRFSSSLLRPARDRRLHIHVE